MHLEHLCLIIALSMGQIMIFQENEDTQMRAQIDNLEGNLSRNNDVEDTLTPPKCVTYRHKCHRYVCGH